MTSTQFNEVIRSFAQTMQLPAAFARLAEMLKKLSDAGSNHAAEQAIACATAAEADNQRLIACLKGAISYADYASTSGGGSGGSTLYYWGTATVTFAGGAGENHVVTVSADHGGGGLTWVTANTVAFGMLPPDITSGPTYNFFQINAENYVVGTSFDLRVYCPTTPTATNYTVQWVAFPNS